MKNIKFLLKGFVTVLIFTSVTFTAKSQEQKKEETITIKTSAVCSMCKERIEQGMAYEKGIRDVTLDLETKMATIRYNPLKTSPEEIRKAISKLGYDADEIPADEKAYNKLPACCKKDAEKH